MFVEGSKAQRIRQGAEYQLAQKQAIGPSHEGEKSPVGGRAPREALLQFAFPRAAPTVYTRRHYDG